MQTTLQFTESSTLKEWSNFKGKLTEAKSGGKPLLKSGSNAENLFMHLTQQLQSGAFK